MSKEFREGLAKAIDDALHRCECCDCSAEYEAAADATIAYIRQHDDWQPIETAPRDGTHIFIFRDGWECAPVAFWGDGEECAGWCFEDDSVYVRGAAQEGFLGWQEDIDDDAMPTHWRPLPAPPKEQPK
jgi:hypothetical protein